MILDLTALARRRRHRHAGYYWVKGWDMLFAGSATVQVKGQLVITPSGGMSFGGTALES